MTRQLEISTLEGAAEHYAAFFLLPDRRGASGKRWASGPSYVMQDLRNFTYKDEFEALRQMIVPHMGSATLAKFNALADKKFTARDDKVFHTLLADKLAITPDGDHMEGKIGTVSVGTRVVGRVPKRIVTAKRTLVLLKPDVWQIYAGETDERLRPNAGVADPLPDTTEGLPTGANVPNFSAEIMVAALDAISNNLDEGSTAATIRGRTGAQPADPDAAETGTLLFTLTMSSPAFPGAVDDGDGTVSETASAITDDSSADATNTLSYCRIGATGTGADDHIDGEAGTSGADFNFNTLAIVSGATVSMTSLVLNLSQGSTAS